MITPAAVLSVGGVDVAAGANPDGTWPDLMALDGAKVKWGRDDALAQPTPATADAAVFDPAGTWATSADWIGQPLELRWISGATSRTYFRGRVASVQVTPHTARRGAGRVTGALVTFTATSVLVDLANRRPADPTVTWPAETLAARRTRIAAQLTGPVSGVATRPTWDAAPLAARESPGDAKLLDLLTELLGNAGADRFTYDPDTRTVDWIARRAYPSASAARLVRDPARPGVSVTGPAVQRTPGDAVEPSVTIPAAVVEYDGGASRDAAARITRVTLTYPGTGQGFTVLTPNTDEAAVGIRSLDVATQHTDDTTALAAANDLSALVAGEAAGWRLEPLRWDTTKTGGFETIAQAELLLAGRERSGVFWLAGSWLPGYGVRPLFGISGGTITCRGGGWLVEFTVAPTTATDTADGITWDELDPALVWDDVPAAHPDRFHDSVTYGDLAFVTSPTIGVP